MSWNNEEEIVFKCVTYFNRKERDCRIKLA